MFCASDQGVHRWFYKKKEAGEASSSAPQRDGQQSAGHSAVRARASPGLLAPAAHGHSRETF